MIAGNISGVRQSILDELEALYELEPRRDLFIPREIVDKMAEVTRKLNREVSVFITRRGMVADISLGDNDRVTLPQLQTRRGEQRLSGVRCIHTHPGGDPHLSAVDLSSLQSLRLDAMAALAVPDREDVPLTMCVAYLAGRDKCMMEGPLRAHHLPHGELLELIGEAERCMNQERQTGAVADEAERALLVGLEAGNGGQPLEELARLADTAGAKVIAAAVQNRETPDSATFLGSGKVSELALQIQALKIDIVIFDEELTGAQTRNLEQAWGVKVIDRTGLILDIFAQRANSREGKLQVELAQMKYLLPRLMGMGQVLSRLGGGIGTRGPGETKLEVDRRRIRRRIFELEQEIEKVARQRELRRARREQNSVPVVALVGYTNAGKSTLLNRLSGSEAFVEDKLFATLDPLSRRIELPSGREALLVDTVGFIDKLPHDLVDAFRSTLEEVRKADLLVHVVDGASGEAQKHYEVVGQVLRELGAMGRPTLTVVNKAELRRELDLREPVDAAISAKTDMGIDLLLQKIDAALRSRYKLWEGLLPYTKGDVHAFLHRQGRVLKDEAQEQGFVMEVELAQEDYMRLQKMLGE